MTIWEASMAVLGVTAAVSSGMMLAFSNFIMKALDGLPATEATRARSPGPLPE